MKITAVVIATLVAAAYASPEANPWRPRGGRGIYRREATAEAFHPREGGPIYTITKRSAEPEAEPNPWRPRGGRGIYRREAEAEAEPEAFHPREGGPIYTITKRSAEAEPGRIRAVGEFNKE
ncbi:hypothetical protein EDC01DRAFT_776209 [Geopyxis carbonaria]|nr:hypothetical protein EDC01DRAFT_776209 [Geopyxis carbonaria]